MPTTIFPLVKNIILNRNCRLDSLYCPALTSVHGSVSASALNFIARHSETLQHLSLTDVKGLEGLNDISFPQLDHLHLFSSYPNPITEEFEDLIRGHLHLMTLVVPAISVDEPLAYDRSKFQGIISKWTHKVPFTCEQFYMNLMGWSNVRLYTWGAIKPDYLGYTVPHDALKRTASTVGGSGMSCVTIETY
eukprot:GHVO01010673.1.p1 GENE.GHVO01010673.1~~GHVO01010673.1.p1  ORF type:complete len:207 (-),score=12.89 GHVO01010673.1:19-591(-)